MKPSPLPIAQSARIKRLKKAIQSRDLEAVREISPLVNWMFQYRQDALATENDAVNYQEKSLLSSFWVKPEEATQDGKRLGNREWRNFCEQAIDCMVENGYRLLDDTSYVDTLTEQPDLIPVLARICQDRKITGDRNETAMHMAMIGIPYLEQVEKSFAKGADINAFDDDGQTPLHWLWSQIDTEHVQHWIASSKWMISQGANPHQLNSAGASALDKLVKSISPAKALGSESELVQIMQEHLSQKNASILDRSTPQSSFSPPRRSL